MSDSSVGACIIAVFGLGFIGLLVFLIRWANQAEKLRLIRWQQFAASTGLRFYPDEGPWYARKAARLEGTIQDVPLTIDTYVVSNGKTTTTYTRVRGRSVAPLPVTGRVYREHLLSSLGDMLGFQDIVVGDEPFDKACVVKGDNEDQMRALLNKPLRDAVLGFLSRQLHGSTFHYAKGESTITWVGAESNPEVLGSALAVAIHAGCFRGPAQQVFR